MYLSAGLDIPASSHPWLYPESYASLDAYPVEVNVIVANNVEMTKALVRRIQQNLM